MFPVEGSALARYAGVFDATEINSTFKRSHRATTYERWRDAAPPNFRFSIKTPKAITHESRLIDCEAGVEAFAAEAAQLGTRLGPVLLQLPPSLPFDSAAVESFIGRMRGHGEVAIACEPRHASWFTAEVDGWLADHRIARVAADPARHPRAGEPGGWRGLTYHRLHGSPRVYYSAYGAAALATLAERLARDAAAEVWCVFDNTASGAAAADALALKAALTGE